MSQSSAGSVDDILGLLNDLGTSSSSAEYAPNSPSSGSGLAPNDGGGLAGPLGRLFDPSLQLMSGPPSYSSIPPFHPAANDPVPGIDPISLAISILTNTSANGVDWAQQAMSHGPNSSAFHMISAPASNHGSADVQPPPFMAPFADADSVVQQPPDPYQQPSGLVDLAYVESGRGVGRQNGTDGSGSANEPAAGPIRTGRKGYRNAEVCSTLSYGDGSED